MVLGIRVMVCLLLGWMASGAVWAAPAPQPDASVEGIWQGELQVPGGKLRVVFHLSRKPDGTLAGTLDSPDQGASGIPLGKVSLQGETVRIEVPDVGGSFEGKLDPAAGTITGVWKQPAGGLPLVLRRVGEAPEVRRPQEPRPPFPYRTDEVSFPNAKAGITLAGTLTLPQGEGPFPAVLLISGSGPQDRNEEIVGHKPFLVLADALTRRGIAVLRVDDRGVGESTGDFGTATSLDFAGDVEAGLQFLRTRKEVDGKRIGLLGHSEGALIAPLVASKDPGVAFLVLIAPPGIPGEQLLYLQGERIAQAAGASARALARERALQTRLFRLVKSEPDPAVVEKQARQILTEAALATAPGRKLPEGAQAQIDAQVSALISPWFRFFLSYDPVPAMSNVRCPVLIITGEKDLQVPPKENLPPLEAALKAGGNPDFKVVVLPGLNHLLQPARTGAPAEYAAIEETISPAALKVVTDWLTAHTG